MGGLALYMAKRGASVVGLDHSSDAIAVARDLLTRLQAAAALGQSSVTLPVALKDEGNNIVEKLVPVSVPSGRMDFRCADPMCVPAEMRDFDFVVVNDVIDSLASPNALLGRLGGVRGLVKPAGGRLAVISAYQWTADATPEALWLGGGESGKQAEEVLAERLAEDFELVRTERLPLMWNRAGRLLEGKIFSLSIFQRK